MPIFRSLLRQKIFWQQSKHRLSPNHSKVVLYGWQVAAIPSKVDSMEIQLDTSRPSICNSSILGISTLWLVSFNYIISTFYIFLIFHRLCCSPLWSVLYPTASGGGDVHWVPSICLRLEQGRARSSLWQGHLYTCTGRSVFCVMDRVVGCT